MLANLSVAVPIRLLAVCFSVSLSTWTYPALWKGGDASYNSNSHKADRDDRPDHTPALRGSSVPFRELACIGAVDFPQDEVVANVPDTVETRHYANEKHHETESLGV